MYKSSMMDKEKIYYARASFGDTEKQAVMKCLDEFQLSPGKYSDQFEKAVAKLFAKDYGVMVNSGSSALMLVAELLNIKPGDEIITSGSGFPTTINPFLAKGAKIIFVDINAETLSPNLDEIEKAISAKTEAIIIPHIWGALNDMKALKEIADRYDVPLVEDSCFPAGTKVVTLNGEVNIENIKAGDFVLTRKGYKKVLASECTGIQKIVTRFGITATSNHPFITTKGLKRFDCLNESDIIYKWNQEQSIIEEKSIIDNQTLLDDNLGFIIGGIQRKFLSLFIDRFGLTTLERYLKDISSTIKITTHSITTFLTSNLYLEQNIPAIIPVYLNKSRKLGPTLRLSETSQSFGTLAQKVENGITNTVKTPGIIEGLLPRIVNFVKLLTRHISQIGLNTVRENVKVVPVFNLKVIDCPEFFANGVLVHNCDSIGQTINGKPSGYWADISVTSFFPSHVITACGGGGMIIVKTEEEEKRLRVLRDWGRTGTDSEDLEDRFNVNLDGIPYDAKFFYGERGYNLKATEVQAAFGLEQLKKLDNWNDIRRKNYENLFGIVSSFGHAVIKPSAPNCQASWLAFPFLVWGDGERTKLAKYLELNNIQTRPILAGNFTRHPAYKDANYQIIDTLQGCDIVTRHGLGIGLHQDISQDQINYIKKVLEEYK